MGAMVRVVDWDEDLERERMDGSRWRGIRPSIYMESLRGFGDGITSSVVLVLVLAASDGPGRELPVCNWFFRHLYLIRRGLVFDITLYTEVSCALLLYWVLFSGVFLCLGREQCGKSSARNGFGTRVDVAEIERTEYIIRSWHCL